MNPAEPITVEEIAEKVLEAMNSGITEFRFETYREISLSKATEIIAMINARAGSQGGGEAVRSAIEVLNGWCAYEEHQTNKQACECHPWFAKACGVAVDLEAEFNLPADVEPQQRKADVEAVKTCPHGMRWPWQCDECDALALAPAQQEGGE